MTPKKPRLPKGWKRVRIDDEEASLVVAGWARAHEGGREAVSLWTDGVVECSDSQFPVALLPHITAAWEEHRKAVK